MFDVVGELLLDIFCLYPCLTHLSQTAVGSPPAYSPAPLCFVSWTDWDSLELIIGLCTFPYRSSLLRPPAILQAWCCSWRSPCSSHPGIGIVQTRGACELLRERRLGRSVNYLIHMHAFPSYTGCVDEAWICLGDLKSACHKHYCTHPYQPSRNQNQTITELVEFGVLPIYIRLTVA